jgi:hypothetical protein
VITGGEIYSISDSTSRTHLLLAHLGIIDSLDGLNTWHFDLHLEVGEDACANEFAQSAALTTVTLAVRAECTVSFSLADQNCKLIFRAKSSPSEKFADKLSSLGATFRAPSFGAFVIGIGEVPIRQGSSAPQIQLTWDGWVGAIRPLGIRLSERPGCILSAILAAAIGVSEAFHYFIGHLDAGWRELTLSLWDPLALDPLLDVGPQLTYWPDKWTLVGLGHIGQANAWCISALPYSPGECEIFLIDDDSITQANLSTGVFTSDSDVITPPLRKTRMMSRVLEQWDIRTRMIEVRLPESFVWNTDHPETALIGVDNLELRRRLSDIDWPLCVDVGLGSTPSSFASLSIHVFPGPQLSSQVRSWNAEAKRLNVEDLGLAFEEMLRKTGDTCGVLMLAERAVATAFVGMTAACLAVAEPLRRLNGGIGIGALGLVLDTLKSRGSRSVDSISVPAD